MGSAIEWEDNSVRSASLLGSGDDGDHYNADKGHHDHCDDDLHLAIAAPHLPLYLSGTSLEH